jgi:hypothetical protein
LISLSAAFLLCGEAEVRIIHIEGATYSHVRVPILGHLNSSFVNLWHDDGVIAHSSVLNTQNPQKHHTFIFKWCKNSLLLSQKLKIISNGQIT